MFSKFLLGTLKVDDAVKQILGRTPLDLVARHAVCDFGVVSPRQYKANLLALEEAETIVSEYLVELGSEESGRVRVTTRTGWDRTDVTWIKPQPKPKRKTNGVPF